MKTNSARNIEPTIEQLEARLTELRQAMTPERRAEFDRLTKADSEVVGAHRRGRVGDSMLRTALKNMINQAVPSHENE